LIIVSEFDQIDFTTFNTIVCLIVNGGDHKLESLNNCKGLVAELVSFEKTKLKQAFNLIGCAINDKIEILRLSDDCLKYV